VLFNVGALGRFDTPQPAHLEVSLQGLRVKRTFLLRVTSIGQSGSGRGRRGHDCIFTIPKRTSSVQAGDEQGKGTRRREDGKAQDMECSPFASLPHGGREKNGV
jgi:hypothetical protein